MTKTNLTKFTLLLLIAFFTSATKLWADNTPVKYGNVTEAELSMKVYDKDTSAAAVVLVDYGEIGYDVSTSKHSYICRTTITGKIKILKKTGLEYATIEISEYDKNGSKERINSFKGCTYNLVNGKIEKTKLSMGDRLEEKKDDYNKDVKFTFKNVKEGSVIEYTYEIESDFIASISPWRFQQSIPVAFSEVVFDAPEFLTFNFTQKGYLSLDINEKESIQRTFMYYTQVMPTQITRYKWGIKNIPAFKKEPYATASKNYISCIDFHIAAITSGNGVVHSYAQSWDDVCKYLRENDDFGKQLKSKKWTKELSTQLSSGKTPKDAMIAIYNYVKTNMKWNEKNSIGTSNDLDETFKVKTGNTADINLLLTLLLKEAGIIAYPVILSTREHGKVLPVHPNISDFNYVITKCTLDGNEYTLDATEKNTPFGMLPERCLNDQGWTYKDMVLEPSIIKPSGAYRSIVNQVFSFSDSKFKGKIMDRKFEYAALEAREKMKNLKEEKLIENLEKSNNGLKVSSLSITNKDSLNKPLQSLYEVEISDNADITDKMIYFKPMFFEKKTKNIFETEKRLYPVEFSEPISETTNSMISIPDGYSIAELPKDTVIKLEDNSVQFTFNVSNVGSTISIISKIDVRKTLFLPEQYADLRKIFSEIVAKHQDQVVLKKI